MKIEYDPKLDLLYIWLGTREVKAAETVTIVPGIHADFDVKKKLVGIEILDASEIVGQRLQFEVGLPIATVQPPERERDRQPSERS